MLDDYNNQELEEHIQDDQVSTGDLIRTVCRKRTKRLILTLFPIADQLLTGIAFAVLIVIVLCLFRARVNKISDQSEFVHVLHEGTLRANTNDFDTAISYLDRAVVLDGNDFDARYQRGRLFMRWAVQEERPSLIDSATNDFKRAIQLGTLEENQVELADCHYWVGRACKIQDDSDRSSDRSIEEFSLAIRMDPSHAYALLWRAQAYIACDEFERALEDLRQAIAINPSMADAFEQRAWLRYAQHELEKSLLDRNREIAAYMQVAPDNPKLGNAYFQRGHLMLLMKRYDQAIADYRWASLRHPNFYEATKYIELAESLQSRGPGQ